MGFDLGNLLSQFANASSAASASDQFHEVAQNASPDLLRVSCSAKPIRTSRPECSTKS